MSSALHCCRIEDLGLIRLSGADAADFLHKQITQDVMSLPAGQWRWGGYCNVKGRLAATFMLWRDANDDLLLALPADNAAWLAKRLSMFVLRAKVKVSDDTPAMAAFGLWGRNDLPALASVLGIALPQAPGSVVHGPDFSLLDVSLHGLQRLLLRVDPAQAQQWQARLNAAGLAPRDAAVWQAQRVLGAVAQVQAATREAFVPQMINFELVGGVNFRKGCYPGQEIVARSQYLGKLKRRMGLAHVAGPDAVAPMQDVFAGEAKDPVGLVAEAVPHEGGWLVLFEAPVSVQESGDLRLAEGRRVQPLPLPYELVDVTA